MYIIGFAFTMIAEIEVPYMVGFVFGMIAGIEVMKIIIRRNNDE